MYAQHVTDIIRCHRLSYHIYADDLQIYINFNPKVPGDAAVALFKLSSCIEELRVWLINNMLKLNEAKTEFFISASTHNKTRLSDTILRVGTCEIKPLSTIKNLGIIFDTSMTMNDHITSLSRSINFVLWNLARIRRFVDVDVSSAAMRALVLSKLDYGNALFHGCSSKDLSRLQRLQNRAARIIYQLPRRHPTSDLLVSLHWLPIDKRIQFKILLYAFKVLNGLSPTYLNDCITIYVPLREGLRSHNDPNRLAIPKSCRRIGDSSFSTIAPKLWNELPKNIRSMTSIGTFKRELKTYLF